MSKLEVLESLAAFAMLPKTRLMPVFQFGECVFGYRNAEHLLKLHKPNLVLDTPDGQVAAFVVCEKIFPHCIRI